MSDMKWPDKIDGIDYSVKGILDVRNHLIEERNHTFQLFGEPGAIELTVLLTHTIAYLSYLRDIFEENGFEDAQPE